MNGIGGRMTQDERREGDRLDAFNKSVETTSDTMRIDLMLADAFLRGYRIGLVDGHADAGTIKSEDSSEL
jgi:hypothetical protein